MMNFDEDEWLKVDVNDSLTIVLIFDILTKFYNILYNSNDIQRFDN